MKAKPTSKPTAKTLQSKKATTQYHSTKLGTIEYNEDNVIHFPFGLFGFEKSKQYALIEDGKESFFKYLQALDNPDITFVVCNPLEVVEGYELVIDRADLEGLGLSSTKDLANLVIATIPDNYEEMSVNLLGSIIVNVKNKLAKQIISKNEHYGTKHYLLKNSQKRHQKVI